MKTLSGEEIVKLPDGGSLSADEGWFMPSANPFQHSCCDCGLTHRVEWALVDKVDNEIIEDPEREKLLYLEDLGIVLRFTRDQPETKHLRSQKSYPVSV